MDTINALGGMLAIPQWFVWRLTWDQEENKFQKMPCYSDGSKYRMDASDSSNWQTFANARNTLQTLRTRNDGHAYTLGFWLTLDTGYWFFDLDKCVTDGKLTPLAQQLAAGFNGAAWEWSSSGTGLHLFGRGAVPEHRRKGIKGIGDGLEFYNDKRGVAFGLSGQFFGNADTDHSSAVAWLVANYFPPQALPGEVLDSEFDRPHASYNGPADDDELIARMRRAERMDAAAVFAGLPAERATFSDLFDGNMETLTRLYAGASDMDFALIGALSFWTGRDAIRTERIARRSALYRDKWESQRGKDTYIRYSILRQFRIAHAEGRPVYGAQRSPSEPVTIAQQHAAYGPDTATVVGMAGHLRSTDTPIVTVTVTTADPAKQACLTQHRAAFAHATDAGELETAALAAKADPRLTDDLAESLAHDLHQRFDEIQVKKRIQWCRAILLPERPQLAAGQHRDCTEFGNVARMMDRYGASLMFVDETEQWYKWDERQWTLMSARAVSFLAKETIDSIFEEARAEENEEMRARLMAWAADSQKNNMVRNMVMLAQSEPRVFVRAALLDANTAVMGAPNGIIDLQTGALLPPDKNHRITQYVRVDYDPAADCPWFKQTVREAFFDDIEMVTFFKRLMGYTLLGQPREHVLIIPYGRGRNGKSTIINTIAQTLGTYSANAASGTFTTIDGERGSAAGGPREDLVRLRGARMLTISEVDENAHLREAIVKSLTGDDPITARGVQAKQSLTYLPRFVAVMSTNHKPIIKGSDDGIWGRILMIPFERNFRKDPHLKEDIHRGERIATELPGVLRWLVEGAIEYQAVGLMRPRRIENAASSYRDDMDILKEWIDTWLEFDPAYAVSAADLFTSWSQFAQRTGDLRYVSTKTSLTRKLNGRDGFTYAQHKMGIKGRCWLGVRLKSAAEVTFNG
jgi:P4 family phage/plasmid primase-like protien